MDWTGLDWIGLTFHATTIPTRKNETRRNSITLPTQCFEPIIHIGFLSCASEPKVPTPAFPPKRETQSLVSLAGHPRKESTTHVTGVGNRRLKAIEKKVELPLKLCDCWLAAGREDLRDPPNRQPQLRPGQSPARCCCCCTQAQPACQPVSTTSGRFASSTPPRAPDHHQRDPPARVPSPPRLPKSPRCSGGPCPGHSWAFQLYLTRAIPPILPTWASSPEKTSPHGASHPSPPSQQSSPRSASTQEAPASSPQQAPSVHEP